MMVTDDWFDDGVVARMLYSREKMAWQHEHGLLGLVGTLGGPMNGARPWALQMGRRWRSSMGGVGE